MRLATQFIESLFTVFLLVLLIRILMSWIPSAPIAGFWRAVYDFFHQSTDWYLGMFRRIIPPIGMVDLSPMVAIIVLYILKGLTISILRSF